MRHPSLAELIEWAEGEFAPARRALVEDHLRQCQRCARAVQRIRDVANLVGRLPAVAAPAGLRAHAAESFLREAPVAVSCQDAVLLLQEHIDGCLSPGASLVLDRHLSSCPGCRAEVAALAATSRALRELPAVESPSTVRERVLDARRRSARPAPFALGWKPAVAVACAAALLGAIATVRPTNRPAPQPRVVLSGEELSVPAPSRLEVARADRDSAESAAPVPLPTAGAESVDLDSLQEGVAGEAPRPAPTGRWVAHVAKGPEPAHVTPETATPEVAMPSGLRALRVVARSATYDAEVQRAMELAEDQYATLQSEALSEARLARLPAALPEAGREEADTMEGEDPLYPSEPESVEEGAAWEPSSAPRPVREGATLLGVPLV